MLKKYKLALLFIPWLLLLIVLLLWSLGIKLPSFNKELTELKNTTISRATLNGATIPSSSSNSLTTRIESGKTEIVLELG